MDKKPTLIVIAESNGSGKTSITTQILKHEWIEGCIYINPDNIAQDELGNWNDEKIVLQAAKIAEQRRIKCIENKENLIFETVFSASNKINFLVLAKREGYFIRLFSIGTNHPIIKRV